MNNETDNASASVRYKGVETNFSGSPEEVWLSLKNFFNEFVPSFKIAEALTLNIDLQKLVSDCEEIIAFSPEGPNLLVSRNKLTDNETLALWLLAHYVGYQLNMLKSCAVPKEELQIKLGKSSKIASTRIGELVKNEIIAKAADEKYEITTFGVSQIQKEILPRVKSKIHV